MSGMSKRRFRVSPQQAQVLQYAVPLGTTLAGLFATQPSLWFDTLARLSILICGAQLVLAMIWELLSRYVITDGVRLQAGKKDPPKFLGEALESTMTMYMVACLTTWPVTQWRRGEATALKWTFADAAVGPFPICFCILELFVAILGADAWTFSKHYLLHTPALFVFHKAHHRFHDPSTFAGFALHPFEALWTFGPIPLFCCSWIPLYAPVHLSMLGFFAALNLYLHCGYSVPFLEWLLPKFWINTSKWHNKHHLLSVTHFGEMLTLWDYILGTHSGSWSEGKVKEQALSVMAGQTGKDAHEDLDPATTPSLLGSSRESQQSAPASSRASIVSKGKREPLMD